MSRSRLFCVALFASSQLCAMAAQVVTQGPVMLGSPMGMVPEFSPNEIVKNAPVATRITTRSVQQLCDGNRIVHEHTVLLYRDSTGRVRREVVTDDRGGPDFVTLADPANRQSFLLDLTNKVAIETPPFDAMIGHQTSAVGGVGVVGAVRIDQSTTEPGAGVSAFSVRVPDGELPASGAVVSLAGPGSMMGRGQTVVEALGQDKLDGVRVEGTAYTTTYPANAFGNEKPIVVRKETWFAPELQMIVRSQEQDPRTGTVSVEAKILATDEPDGALFEVPADFKRLGPGP